MPSTVQPDYDWDHEMIPCYEFESEESMKINLNSLSFSYTFEYDNDIVFFSYFQPYTLTDLEDLLFMLKSKFPEEHLNSILKINKMCETMAGNPCYLLTITSDVKKNDVILGKPTEGTSEPVSSKLKSNSGHNVNAVNNSAPSKTEKDITNSNVKAKEETDKSE